MKTFILLLSMATVALSSCYSAREIQVEMVSAQLIRIDTVYRYAPDEQKQQLTWRDDQNTEYVSFASMNSAYLVGTRMAVLRKR
jgi:hypothetical protein